MEVELEVVGKHALLFDDDATSAFVNSKDALIEWNSLFIDRFDVRNLLSDPPSSFRKLPGYGGPSPDAHLQSQLDLERYADLPSSDEQEIESEVARTDASGYHFVPFSYGNSAESSDQKNLDVVADASVFHPPFSVPESLLQNLMLGAGRASSDLRLPYRGTLFPFDVMKDGSCRYSTSNRLHVKCERPLHIIDACFLFFSAFFQPPSEKVHQIIARTALFVGEHGGQSEIILRVKQGDNPTFGFLMPHHHLHPYFRYLVDHLELLKAEHDDKPQEEKSNEDQTGGSLSLLGSVYGTGEDEDGGHGAGVVDRESKKVKSDENSTGDVMSSPHQLEQVTGPRNVAEKDEVVSKGVHPSKVKASALTKPSISSIKSVNATAVKKDGDIVASTGSVMDKLKTSSLFPVFKAEPLIVDPPSEVKRLVDRIVEIILKNGKDFETVLIEQDKKHGRFPFLLPYNQYHQYYLKVLKKAQESRLSCKSITTEKDVFQRQEMDRNTKESNSSSLGSESYDLPLDYDKKEKFKMVINKFKKDTQDHPTKEPQQQSKITVDTAAAAAILQAATRGTKKPNLDMLAKTSLSSASHGSSNEGGQASSLGSFPSSQRQTSSQKQMENGKPGVTIPVAKEIAKTAALAAASEADSSEAGLTREQKLKAERLRRAKMFAAMIKGGVAPLGTEPQRAASVEPPKSGVPSSADEVVNRELKDRVGSSVPAETGTSNRIEMSVRITSDDEIEKKAGKRRHYRSRKHGDKDEDKYEGEEDIDEEEDDDLRQSRKKHRSNRSSQHHRDKSKDVHKHRRKHSSSRSKESRHRHKRESSSPDDDDHHSRYKHDSSTDDEHKHRKRRPKHDGSTDDEHKHHKRRHKHDSSEDEHKHRKRKHKRSHNVEDKHKGRSKSCERKSRREEVELEEGEIRTKSSDHSSSAIGDDTSTEVSVDASKSSFQEKAPSMPPPETTEVPDELRAKIRAMLLANM